MTQHGSPTSEVRYVTVYWYYIRVFLVALPYHHIHDRKHVIHRIDFAMMPIIMKFHELYTVIYIYVYLTRVSYNYFSIAISDNYVAIYLLADLCTFHHSMCRLEIIPIINYSPRMICNCVMELDVTMEIDK